jgi:hypothetical protein
VGKIEILTNLGHVGTLRKVLYAQEVPLNLLSVRRMQEAGISVIFSFTHNGEVIAKIGQKTIMTGKRMNELYSELYVLYFTVQNTLSIQTNGQATITRLKNKDTRKQGWAATRRLYLSTSTIRHQMSSMSTMSIKRRHCVNNIDNVGDCNNVRLCMT